METHNLESNAGINEEENHGKVIIGKVILTDIKIKNILQGIANLEMEFGPAIGQTIFFFDPKTDRAFHMYDDRGCFVFGDQANKIRDIYLKRNEWIVDYHRNEIDDFFR